MNFCVDFFVFDFYKYRSFKPQYVFLHYYKFVDMKKSLLIFSFLLIIVVCSGCITPEVTTNYKIYPKPEKLRNLYVALMPLLADELSYSEIEDVTDEIVNELSGYGNIRQIVLPEKNKNKLFEGRKLRTWEKISYYRKNRIVNKFIDSTLLENWAADWRNYLNKKDINQNELMAIGNTLDVNAVLQFAVADLKRVRPIHRKVIGETTAVIKYALFSVDGELLVEGESVATQANAWSGQLTPLPIEVVDVAIDDIFDKFTFYNSY